MNAALSCPVPCGGDPLGTWHVVGGCVVGKVAGPGAGAVVGNLTVTSAGSGYTFAGEIDYDYAAGGGYFNSGGDNFSQGVDPDAGPDAGPGSLQYCVKGANLWVFPSDLSLDIEYAK